jgi:hypothetical protein
LGKTRWNQIELGSYSSAGAAAAGRGGGRARLGARACAGRVLRAPPGRLARAAGASELSASSSWAVNRPVQPGGPARRGRTPARPTPAGARARGPARPRRPGPRAAQAFLAAAFLAGVFFLAGAFLAAFLAGVAFLAGAAFLAGWGEARIGIGGGGGKVAETVRRAQGVGAGRESGWAAPGQSRQGRAGAARAGARAAGGPAVALSRGGRRGAVGRAARPGPAQGAPHLGRGGLLGGSLLHLGRGGLLGVGRASAGGRRGGVARGRAGCAVARVGRARGRRARARARPDAPARARGGRAASHKWELGRCRHAQGATAGAAGRGRAAPGAATPRAGAAGRRTLVGVFLTLGAAAFLAAGFFTGVLALVAIARGRRGGGGAAGSGLVARVGFDLVRRCDGVAAVTDGLDTRAIQDTYGYAPAQPRGRPASARARPPTRRRQPCAPPSARGRGMPMPGPGPAARAERGGAVRRAIGRGRRPYRPAGRAGRAPAATASLARCWRLQLGRTVGWPRHARAPTRLAPPGRAATVRRLPLHPPLGHPHQPSPSCRRRPRCLTRGTPANQNGGPRHHQPVSP